jgi:hypothetical protein
MDIQPSIHTAETIEGWMYPRELMWLAQTASKSKMIIEVGCFKGRSTRAICDNTKGQVIAVDPYMGAYYNNDDKQILNFGNEAYEEFKKNLEDYLEIGKLRHFRNTFSELPKPIKADFIFIDGDHREEPFRNDVECALKHALPGAIISGHDYGDTVWTAIKKVVDEKFTHVSICDTIWWTKL